MFYMIRIKVLQTANATNQHALGEVGHSQSNINMKHILFTIKSLNVVTMVHCLLF